MKGNPEVIFSLACAMFKPMTRSNSGPNVMQQLETISDWKQAALTVLRPGIKIRLDAQDDATRELVEHFVVDEEHHIDRIETQFHQIKEVGYENYLAQQIFKKS